MNSSLITVTVNNDVYDWLRGIKDRECLNSMNDVITFIKREYNKQPTLVQTKNPVTKHWVLINRDTGSIIKHSRTSIPYKHIPILQQTASDGGNNAK